MIRKALWTQSQSQPRLVKLRKPIRRRTVKRAAEERRYRARVKEWLMLSENRYCAVYKRIGLARGVPFLASQVHHSHGRVGRLLLYELWWVPVSDWGHRWIEEHPEQARKLKLLCPLGQWNSPPPC